jgi:hypothetical protein
MGLASLIATAFARLARVVFRSRVILAAIEAGTASDPVAVREWLERNEPGAFFAERSVGLFFAAVIVFVAGCLAIGADYFLRGRLT